MTVDSKIAATMRCFRSTHTGNRCAILCNGDSLWSFPASYPWDTIGINRSWMICPAPRYHFVLSPGQLDALSEWQGIMDCLIVGSHRGQDRIEFVKNARARSCVLVEGWTQNDCVTRGIGFAMDLEKEQPWAPNTPYLALQFARYMGYKHIDLWGLDLCGPKFWNKTWTMNEGPAKQQDVFFNYAAKILEDDGVRVVNRNMESECTAFEKEVW